MKVDQSQDLNSNDNINVSAMNTQKSNKNILNLGINNMNGFNNGFMNNNN